MRGARGSAGPGRPRRLASVAAAAAMAAAALSLGSCSSVRNDLGTGASGCYVALPAAASAVHHAGRLDGVILVGTAALRLRQLRLYRVASVHRQHTVCLVAFTGHFTAGSVARPMGKASGNLAVVELGYPDHRLLATLLVTRQPLPFGHSHILPF